MRQSSLQSASTRPKNSSCHGGGAATCSIHPFLFHQRQVESCVNAAGRGHRIEHHAADNLLFFLAVACFFLELQRPVPRPARGLHGDVDGGGPPRLGQSVASPAVQDDTGSPLFGAP